ncbi:MAG: cation diffusion facilitator family transporter [Alphaproteobacteria bacterium]
MSYKEENADIDPYDRQKYALRAMRGSLAVVFLLLSAKLWVAVTSGSAAMLGSMIDTLGDGVLSLVGYISLRISMMPADEEHRHGHGKAEGFSAFLQASFLCGSAVFLAFESVSRFFSPQEIVQHYSIIGVSCFALFVTVILVLYQRYALRKAPSLIVEADQRHYVGDIGLNAGVIAAAVLSLYAQNPAYDSAIGLLIAVYIGYSGFDIGKKATDMLMDREIGADEREKIADIIRTHDGVLGWHDLRTRRSGMTLHISMDLELDGGQSLRKAHEVTRAVEFSLLKEFRHAEIIIHMDPHGDTYDTRHKVHGIHR